MLLGVELQPPPGASLSVLGVYHSFDVLSSLLLFVTVFVSCWCVCLTFVCWCGICSSVFFGVLGLWFL